MGDGIERRWRNLFLRPLAPSDDEVIEEIRAAFKESHWPWLAETFDELLDGQAIRVGDYGSERERLRLMRLTMNTQGLEVSGGGWPHANHRLRFLGRVAEGAPTAACLLGPWEEDTHLLSGALFIEALPVGATPDMVEAALELLPPLPRQRRGSLLPTYGKTLNGRWAEWVLSARDILALAGLDLAQSST